MKKIFIYLFCLCAIFICNDFVLATDTELNITMLQFPSGTNESGEAYKNAGGDAVLLESKGEYLLMDTMNPTSIREDALLHPIVQYLKDNSVTKISIYLSHYHSDHYGGLKNLLLDNGITIERVYVPRTEYFCKYYDVDRKFNNNYFYKRYKDLNNVENPETGYTYRFYAISNQNIPITYLWPDTNAVYTEEENGYKNCFGLVEKKYSNKIQLGDARIDIIGPKGNLNLEDIEVDGLKLTDYKTGTGKTMFQFAQAENAQEGTSLGALKKENGDPLTYDTLTEYGNIYINNYSLVAMISVGNTKFFTAGDIGANQENELLNSGINLKADIMKVSHHVNESSNKSTFIKAVSPKYMFAQNQAVKNPDAMLFNDDGSLKQNDYMNSLRYMIYGDGEECTNNCFSGANMYFEQYSGFTNFNIKNDVINAQPNYYVLPIEFYSDDYTFKKNGAIALDDNIKTVTINYIDKATNEIISSRVFKFGRAVTYHLYDFIPNISGYTYISDDAVVTGKIMKNDDNKVFNAYYQKNIVNNEENNEKASISEIDSNKTSSSEKIVEVDNTLSNVSIVLLTISIILIVLGIGIIIYYKYIVLKKKEIK